MNLPYTGSIPYDENAVKAINDGKTIVDIVCDAGFAVRKVFNNTIRVLLDKNQQ